MTNLSPAAEAIFFAADGMQPRQYRGRALAAALRAAADQVVPQTNELRSQREYDLGQWDARDNIRDRLLAIAAELEGAND